MDDLDIQAELTKNLNRYQTVPFLFVGSGLSRRYLGLENWEDLLRKFSSQININFGYYLTTADGDMPRAAKLLAKEFADYWWKSDDFRECREQFDDHHWKIDIPLKIEISNYMNESSSKFVNDPNIQVELKIFKNITINGIITTNWDTLLERLFPDFDVFVGQEELLFSQPQSVAEIYKIHGCCSRPDSLIVTDSDYEKFKGRNSYLAAKLLTIFIEHPVIFMGYSLSDDNILDIFTSMSACLGEENLNKLKDRLFFVEWDSEDEGNEIYPRLITTGEGKNIPLTVIRTKSFIPIYEALQTIKRKFPAKQLRLMKEQLYELVTTNDPNNKIYVMDIDDQTQSSDIEFVIGIGAIAKISKVGYKGIEINNLFEDIVFNTGGYHAEDIVRETLPELKKGRKYLPIFKYLKAAGYLDDNTRYNSLNHNVKNLLDNILEEGFSYFSQAVKSYAKKQPEIQDIGNIANLCKYYDYTHVLHVIHLLRLEQLSTNELHKFLVDHFDLLYSDKQFDKTSFRRLICLYDWMYYYDLGSVTDE